MARFNKLKEIKISKDRNLIISENEDGDLVLAQQLVIQEEHRPPTKMFIKNSIIIGKDKIEDVSKALQEVSEKMNIWDIKE